MIKMTNVEKQEWKMNLFEIISDAKNSMNIIEIKEETEFLFDLCTKMANVGDYDSYQKDLRLKANLHNAFSSYYLEPNLSMEQRVPFINGIIFASESLVENESVLKDLSLEEKITMVCKQFNEMANSNDDFPINEEYLSYVMLGINMELTMNQITKRKK